MIKLTFVGLEQLKRELANLPAELVGEGTDIVTSHATGARDDIAAGYEAHRRTGHLAAGLELRTRDTAGRGGIGLVLRNRAPHAGLFDNGTQARHTKLGANRGSMPAGKIFVPRVQRWRRKMYGELKGLLERKGLKVSGEP